jgi:plasmid stabilization system protein ParE
VKTDFSPTALADLEEIGLYIARDNPRAALA